MADDIIQNYTFDELAIGMSAQLTQAITIDHVKLFAAVSGDPVLAGNAEWVSPPGALGKRPAHAALSGTLLSRLIGTKLPGPGSSILAESLRYHYAVGVGDSVTVSVTVTEKRPQGNIVFLDCAGVNQHGDPVLNGTMEVGVLTQKVSVARMPAATISVQGHDSYENILRFCKNLPAVVTAVAHPCDVSSLTAVMDAAKANLIVPILVGPSERIRKVASDFGFDISQMRIEHTPHSHASAARAVELVREGEAEVLMKGSLHTDELMGAVVHSATGLRTGRHISHVFIMDVPTYYKPLFVTDAAVNIYPTLEQKVDIVQNAIDLAHALRISCPKVAILSAVETVTPKIQSTLEAAALCKMADRGQITGGLLEGPLAMDNAISREAAEIKGITSPVAGDADILLVPDLEAGNILAKQLTFMANADAAGIVLGARVPIILTSRADNLHARMASCAVAVVLAHSRREAKLVPPV